MTGPEHGKTEADVDDDPHIARSRADDEQDGSYVGRKASDDDFDAGESGAEARGRHRR
jgi:hypothetical protein